MKLKLAFLVAVPLALTGCVETPQQLPGTPGSGTATQLPGDALVAGTSFNAAGQLSCTVAGFRQTCDFGVVRRGNGNATVYITRPAALGRRIVFEGGRPVASNGGTVQGIHAAGNVTVTLSNGERYLVPDAVMFGG